MATVNDVQGDIEIIAYVVKGIHGSPASISGGPSEFKIKGQDAADFINFLKGSRWGDALDKEFDLQGLCQKVDGTKLLSAMVPPERAVEMFSEAGNQFITALDKLQKWHFGGECDEVVIHFGDGRCQQ